MDMGDATIWAPPMIAPAAPIGGCASIAASWLVVRTQRGMQHDSARAKAYSTPLARAHQVLASGVAGPSEAMTEYLEGYYEVGVLHEVVRRSILGQAVPRELETQTIDDFVRAVKSELGVVEPGGRPSVLPRPGTYRVLRLPRGREGSRHPKV